jgi:hypothetical protein
VAVGLGGTFGVGALASGEAPRDAPPAPPTWEGSNPELAEQRTALQALRRDARRRLNEVAGRAIAEPEGAARRALVLELADVRRILDSTQSDLAEIESQRSAWLAAARDFRTDSYTFVLDVHDLPSDAQVAEWRPDDAAGSGEEASMRAVLAAFGIVVTSDEAQRRAPEDQEPARPAEDGHAYEGVWYRRPRRVTLRIYRRVGVELVQPMGSDAGAPRDGGPTVVAPLGPADDPVSISEALDQAAATESSEEADPWLVLVEEREVEVVDGHCRYGYLPLTSAWFGEKAAAIETGPLGAPTKISTSTTSGLKELADTLGSVPQQVLTGLETGNKIVDQFDSAAAKPENRRLADLERKKKLLEADLALADSAATADLRSQLAAVTAEHDLLSGTRDLEAVARDLDVQRAGAAESRDALLREVNNSVLREQVERLELEAKVTTLEAEAGLAATRQALLAQQLEGERKRLEAIIEKLMKGELPDGSLLPAPPPSAD